MTARTAIITGGTSGLGYEAAKEIAASAPDWRVVITSRSQDHAVAAASRISAYLGGPRVTGMALDLGSLASVRRFARDVADADLPPLRALVCNAGIQVVTGLTFTEDGYESTFAVNHLGHFLLTNLLLGRLVAPARIVVVSSDTHDPAKRTGMPVPRYRDPRLLARPDRDPRAPRERPGTAGRRRYTTSKLCNVLFAYELARRVERQGLGAPGPITVNAFNPGFMPGSGLARDYGRLARLAWRTVLPALASLRGNHNTTAASGKALARLVLDPGLERVSGRYFDRMEEIPSSAESYDEREAAQLWEASVELVGLARSGKPREER